VSAYRRARRREYRRQLRVTFGGTHWLGITQQWLR
jgi:hypothetical protein